MWILKFMVCTYLFELNFEMNYLRACPEPDGCTTHQNLRYIVRCHSPYQIRMTTSNEPRRSLEASWSKSKCPKVSFGEKISVLLWGIWCILRLVCKQQCFNNSQNLVSGNKSVESRSYQIANWLYLKHAREVKYTVDKCVHFIFELRQGCSLLFRFIVVLVFIDTSSSYFSWPEKNTLIR